MYTNVWEGYILIGILKKKKTEKRTLVSLSSSFQLLYYTSRVDHKRRKDFHDYDVYYSKPWGQTGGCLPPFFQGNWRRRRRHRRMLRLVISWLLLLFVCACVACVIIKKEKKKDWEKKPCCALAQTPANDERRRSSGVKKKAQRATFISSFEAHPKTLASSWLFNMSSFFSILTFTKQKKSSERERHWWKVAI